MDPVIVPALTALAGVAIRAITYAELLARLRWQERRQRASHRALTELACELPPGSWLDELRADGSRLHLQAAPTFGPAERPSR
jgi:Tfp pilus assembly protein PilN